MPRTLTFPELRSIRRLLRTGRRHTEIARLLDISVGTVTRIATDRRFRSKHLAEADLPEDEPPPDYQSENLHRCPGCGGMVYVWPCLTCRMRAHAGESRS